MSLEVIGKIKVINAEQVVSAAFKKRELVVTTEEQYPQHIMMEFTQDKCDLLNIYKVGEDVKVSINLRGREWVSPQGDTKYFNTIQAWRIEKNAPGQYSPPAAPKSAVDQYEARSNPSQVPSTEEEPDDLPF
jgi:hypothetical protein